MSADTQSVFDVLGLCTVRVICLGFLITRIVLSHLEWVCCLLPLIVCLLNKLPQTEFFPLICTPTPHPPLSLLHLLALSLFPISLTAPHSFLFVFPSLAEQQPVDHPASAQSRGSSAGSLDEQLFHPSSFNPPSLMRVATATNRMWFYFV